jgi:hypothetical protein
MRSSHWGVGVVLGVAWGLAAGTSAVRAAAVGEPAPEFTLPDAQGQAQALSAQRGKYVVLEWINPECPFVRKHYGSGNMQALQRRWTGEGVVWWSVNSSAPGKQGHLTAETAGAFLEGQGAAPTALLLDPEGVVGRLYGAKTTPHLFLVDPEGRVIYAGAIDDRPSADPADVPGATNYVAQALTEARAGQAVSVPESQPYGCSVKY